MPNALASTYPWLFPYGVGAPEDRKHIFVSFSDHVRWCLQYSDGRFDTHKEFAFYAFGVSQMRDVLISARIQMNRRHFQQLGFSIETITLKDLQRG